MTRTARQSGIAKTHYVREWRNKRGRTLDQLADDIGMSGQNLGRIERGLVPLGEPHLGTLAEALGIKPADLFRDPDALDDGERLVQVIGRVGADNEGNIIYTTADETGELVPIPPGGTDKAVALKVVGHSMGSWAPEGSLVYFENQRTPPTPDMLGWPCVVETEDGRVLLKRLLKGSRPGLYDLESLIGPTISDVRLRWAAEVTANVPPRQAHRIIRYAGVKQVA